MHLAELRLRTLDIGTGLQELSLHRIEVGIQSVNITELDIDLLKHTLHTLQNVLSSHLLVAHPIELTLNFSLLLAHIIELFAHLCLLVANITELIVNLILLAAHITELIECAMHGWHRQSDVAVLQTCIRIVAKDALCPHLGKLPALFHLLWRLRKFGLRTSLDISLEQMFQRSLFLKVNPGLLCNLGCLFMLFHGYCKAVLLFLTDPFKKTA
mmetsp:Transcript_99171/g.170839  ORF Transcript_99171/g.170839 Transcript_99171/m.170839 type:complete len:213 (-) Transcript_99171:652-1290(-)